MQLTATKEFSFDCAHLLSGHEGACKNLHGHTYKLEVTVKRSPGIPLTQVKGPSQGMIIDFKVLKDAVNELIISRFDHAFVYWEDGNEAEKALAKVCESYEMKTMALSYRPTAEQMALAFYRSLDHYLSVHGLQVTRIRLWETPTSYAEVTL